MFVNLHKLTVIYTTERKINKDFFDNSFWTIKVQANFSLPLLILTFICIS